jgi:hypothetical protein
MTVVVRDRDDRAGPITAALDHSSIWSSAQ